MSAITAPLISLEQARELVQLLEMGEHDTANQLVQQLAVPGSSELFAEVGSKCLGTKLGKSRAAELARLRLVVFMDFQACLNPFTDLIRKQLVKTLPIH